MTRKRGGSSQGVTDSAEDTAAERATLDEALAELGGAGAVAVLLFRQKPEAPTKWPYVGQFPVTDFSLESVQKEHGGGDYRARIIGANKKFVRQVTFQIDGPAKLPAPPAPTTPPPAAPPSETVALLQAIQGQTDAIRQLALEVRTVKPAGPDPLEYALKIADLVTRGAGGKGAGLGVSDMLELLDRGMELAGGAANGESGGYAPVIREFGKPLLELLNKMADRESALKARRNLPPAPAPENPNGAGIPETAWQPPGPLPPQAPPANAPAWLSHLAPLVPHGLRLAALHLEPESFAPALYQLVPEADLDELEAAATSPTFSLAVLEAYPDTQQYRDWFTRLLEAVRELLLEGAKESAGESAGG